MSRCKTSLMIFIVVALLQSCPANALWGQTILWDQQPGDASVLGSVVNQEIPDQTSFSTYQINDATFSNTVIVDSVTFYFTNLTSSWSHQVDTGVLNIFDGDKLNPLDDPTNGGDYGAASVELELQDIGNNTLAITASNLDIHLDAGTYWFGLTPSVSSVSTGQEFSINTFADTVGQGSMYRNPKGGFEFGTDWAPTTEFWKDFRDISFTVEGEAVPEPSSSLLLIAYGFGVLIRRTRTKSHSN